MRYTARQWPVRLSSAVRGLDPGIMPARHSPSHRFWFLIGVRAGPEHGLHSCAFCGAGGDPEHLHERELRRVPCRPGDPVNNHATAVVDPPATAIECLIKVKS